MGGKTFAQILKMVRRRAWLGSGLLAVIFAGAAATVLFLPDIYRATATVIVERADVTESLVRPGTSNALETRLQSLSQEMLSRARLAGLIRRFGLYAPMRAHGASEEEVVEQMRRDIRLETKGADAGGGQGGTIAFALSYRGRDPRMITVVANALATSYVEENTRTRERQAAGATEFLGAQLRELKARLDEQERRVGAYRARHSGELPQQMEANLSTLERLNTQLHLNGEKQTRLLLRREALTKELAGIDPSTPAGDLEGAAKRLAELRRKLAEMKTLYRDKHPELVRLRAQIAAVEGEIAGSAPADAAVPEGGAASEAPSAGTQPASVGPVVEKLRAEIAGVDAEIAALRKAEPLVSAAIARYQQRVEAAPRREQELKELSRDYETVREQYASLLKRYQEAQLNESMEAEKQGERFRILDPAVVPDSPAAPDRQRLLLAALAAALAAAAAAVLLAERLDTSFHAVEELRAFTRVPVLASIPRFQTARGARLVRRRACLAGVATVVAMGLAVGAARVLAGRLEPLVVMLAGWGS